MPTDAAMFQALPDPSTPGNAHLAALQPVQPGRLTPALKAAAARPAGVGLLLAFLIMGAWAANLRYLLLTPLDVLSWRVIPHFLLQIFLGTGLFITAHDAIHGTLARHRGINTAIGWMCTLSFAMLSYRVLRDAHWEHHRYPTTPRDPDYHDGTHTDPARWFVAFMRRYLSIWLFVLYVPMTWLTLYALVGADPVHILLFWPAPAIISAIQLFYFGTYLPHREPAGGYTNVHCARSNAYGWLLSFLTCYHFGYHEEHHEVPQSPWWRLPKVRAVMKEQASAQA